MTINRAIERLRWIFLLAFALLGLRQVQLQVFAGPRLAANEHNPRNALLDRYRGQIVARDGTVLATWNARGRVYPLGAALAQTVGYTSTRYGTSGLEETYDADLSAGIAANDPVSQWSRIFAARKARAPRGATIVTTLDPAIQTALYSALAEHERGAGIALDPRTGAVLALASVPSFDPGRIDRTFATLAKDTSSPLFNRALYGLYPPGSTFKIVTAADALDAGVVSLDDTFDDPGHFTAGTFVVHDDEGEATGTQSLTGAFALSSNVDFAQIALKLNERWFDYAARWQLGMPIAFDLPVRRDHITAQSDATPGVMAQLGFGQADLAVTPLRIGLIGATIASGGTEPHPWIVRAIQWPGGTEKREAPAPLATPIAPETAADVRTMMVAVVERGTGTVAQIPGVSVAGKTGTATNPAGRAHSWFVAFAPAQSPRVVVAVLVENAGYGAAVAAPIVRRVLRVALERIRT